MQKLFILVLSFVTSLNAFCSIEAVISPAKGTASVEIIRWSLHREGDLVKFGRCDILESECNPETLTLEIQREMSYENYLTRLARRFSISPRYLINHQKAVRSYETYLSDLQAVINSSSSDESEKATANSKTESLTRQDGILDRFNQALALKRALEWPKSEDERKEIGEKFRSVKFPGAKIEPAPARLVFTYEKSVKQFEEALYPLNFAKILVETNPKRLYDPSLAQTWVLAATNVTYIGAIAACSSLGPDYRLPRFSDLVWASDWLSSSTINDLMPVLNGRKYVFVSGEISHVGIPQGKKMKQVPHGYKSTIEKEVDYSFYTYRFSVASIGSTMGKTYVEVSSTDEEPLADWEATENYGNKTAKLNALCVGPAKF